MDWGGDGYNGSSAVLIEIVEKNKRYLKGLFLDVSSARAWLEKLYFVIAQDDPEKVNLQKSLPPTFVYQNINISHEMWVNRQSSELEQVAYIYQMQSL